MFSGVVDVVGFPPLVLGMKGVKGCILKIGLNCPLGNIPFEHRVGS